MNTPQTKAPTFPKPNALFLQKLLTRKAPLSIEFKAAGGRNSDLPLSHCYEIAIIGRSNVGKSSLINYIAGQKNLARTSRTPGRTQTINLFTVEKGRLAIVDLPGYGYAESNKTVQAEWQKAMSEFLQERNGLFAFLFLLDIRRDVTEDDASLFHWLLDLGLTPLVVHTKCDKVHKAQWFNVRKSHAEKLGIAPEQIITTSADTNVGRESMFAGIAGLFSQIEVEEIEDTNEGSERVTEISWHPNPSAPRLQKDVLQTMPPLQREDNGFLTSESVATLRHYHPEVVLFNPQIPPNTGTVSRMCAAFSATLHLIEPLGFTITDQQLRRAGLDYWDQVEICLHKSWDAFFETRRDRRFVFIETGGQLSPDAFAFEPGDILVFGAETYGIPKNLIDAHLAAHRGALVTVPMFHRGVRSINLSNTVSIVLYAAIAKLHR